MFSRRIFDEKRLNRRNSLRFSLRAENSDSPADPKSRRGESPGSRWSGTAHARKTRIMVAAPCASADPSRRGRRAAVL